MIWSFFVLEWLYRDHQTLYFRTVTSEILVLQTNILVVLNHVLYANGFVYFNKFNFSLVTCLAKGLLGSRFHVSFRPECSSLTVVLNRRFLFHLLLGTSVLWKSICRSFVGTVLHVGVWWDLRGLRMRHGIKVRKLGQVVLRICNACASKPSDPLIKNLLAWTLWGIRAVRFAFDTLREILHLVCIWNFTRG